MNNKSTNIMGASLAIGIAFGVGINNIGLGIALGVAIGAALSRRSANPDE